IRTRDRLCQQRPIEPRQRRAVTLHPEEQRVDLTDLRHEPAIKFWLDVAGVRRKEQLTFAQSHGISKLRADVEIRVLAQKGQREKAAPGESKLLQLGHLDDIAEPGVFENELQRGILKRATPATRHDDGAHFVSELKQRLEKDVVLMVVRDDDEV